MKNFQKILILLLISIFITNQNVYACRLLSMIADNGANLSGDVNSGRVTQYTDYLQTQSNSHDDGWGFLYYQDEQFLSDGSVGNIFRGEERADEGGGFDNAQTNLRFTPNVTTLMCHIRRTSSGANSIDNPHPWIMEYNGTTYSFAHNGTINDKEGLRDIIGVDWINAHGGLNTFGLGDWEGVGWPNVVDSELYFFWLMKNIEEEGDILQGLKKALSNDTFQTITNGNSLNFTFSNGEAIWAYKRASSSESGDPNFAHSLYWVENNAEFLESGMFFNYKAVMSQPNTVWANNWGEDWHNMINDQLVYLPRNSSAVTFNNFGLELAVVEVKILKQKWNWVGFPVMDDLDGTSIEPLLAPISSFAEQSIGLDINSFFLNGFWDPIIDIFPRNGYKLLTATDEENYSLPITGSRLKSIAPVSLTSGENWVTYFVDEEQEPLHALPPEVIERLVSIKAQDWYMFKSGNHWIKKSPPICPAEPGAPCITFKYGEMYILTLSSGENINMIYETGNGTPPGGNVVLKTTSFDVQVKEDYTALSIEGIEDPASVKEVAIFLADNCIAAEPVDEFPLYMQAYNGDESMNDISIQVVRDAGLAKSIPDHATQIGHDNMFKEHYKLAKMDKEITEGGFVVYKATIEKSDEIMVMETSLLSVYPNPFNPSTTLQYELAKHEHVSVVIYDMSGRVVENLYQGQQDRGQYELTWNGSDVASGMYFVVFKTSDYQSTQKVMLLK